MLGVVSFGNVCAGFLSILASSAANSALIELRDVADERSIKRQEKTIDGNGIGGAGRSSLSHSCCWVCLDGTEQMLTDPDRSGPHSSLSS